MSSNIYLGAGIFVTTIVVGSILIREHFQIMHRPLLRDIIFYILTTTLVWATFLHERIALSNSLTFIGIYIVYVIVVVTSGIIYRRNQIILNQEAVNGGNRIFHKKNFQMPRDNLKRAKKYRINNIQQQQHYCDNNNNNNDKGSTTKEVVKQKDDCFTTNGEYYCTDQQISNKQINKTSTTQTDVKSMSKSISKLSLKSYFQPSSSDNYEGVVLRRKCI